MASPDIPASDRSRVRRAPDRARYDRGSVHAILDEGLVAHVGIAVEGQPFVLPMAYGRDGEPCPRCGRPLVREIVTNRSSHFCPGCQRLR